MIDFYYWGMQCPYNDSNMRVLKAIEEKYDVEVNYFEMSKYQERVRELQIYSPTFTIFDNQLRWTGPISEELIVKYLEGQTIKRTPYVVRSENKRIEGELKFFIPALSNDIRRLCCSKTCQNSSDKKADWLSQCISDYDLKHTGVLHYVDDECVGGVEFLPTEMVPYDIPKSSDSVFLSCVYASDPEFDYKSHPLKRLEKELKDQGYKTVYAVASEGVAFPNGPLEWFIDHGYTDQGTLYYEENDGADQHLISKRL